ncbi:MAG: T9SS type A sorting domain-containing protein [Rhodothermales bacterium]
MRLPRPVRTGACLLSLTLGVVLGVTPARAQLAVEPSSLAVTVPQGETETRTMTLTNSGSEALAFCLSFDRPLQRTAGISRLSEGAFGSACGTYGEVLFLVDRDDLPGCCADPYGLTITSDGRLFAAEGNGGRTIELDAALNFVRVFDHPVVAEFEPFPATRGVTFNADIRTLWWLNIEASGFDVYRALLLEGDLDGVPTGQRIELPIRAPNVPPDERRLPVGIAYDATRGLFYYTDIRSETIWAVDTLGHVAPGYPIQPDAYPGATLAFGLDSHPSETGTDSLSTRLELYVRPPGASRRVAAIDPYGGDLGAGTSLETPLPFQDPNAETGLSSGEPVRSRVDPNGVLYYPWSSFENSGVLAIRPHPLPPSWLVVEAWDGALAPGESRTLELTFRPGQRSVGDNTAALQAFTAETGEAVEVPLTLTVTQGTDAESGDGALPETATLNVYPNPSANAAIVALTLPTDADLRVTVYDVLGRRVANLADGPFAAGSHRLDLDTAALPGGVYLVRVQSEASVLSRRLVVVR